jgi:probable rRNA maturation factor
MLTDNAHIHEINLEQRGVDRHTDVLSFPMNQLIPEAFDGQMCEYDPGSGRLLLGDMIISLEQCRAQAEEFGHSAEREICYLAVHSVLHLLGYDHMDEGEEKAQMRRHEDAIMEKLNLTR